MGPDGDEPVGIVFPKFERNQAIYTGAPGKAKTRARVPVRLRVGELKLRPRQLKRTTLYLSQRVTLPKTAGITLGRGIDELRQTHALGNIWQALPRCS